MRLKLPTFLAALLLISGSAVSQTESIDEVYIELDSIRKPYTAQARPYVFVRSKKGKSGVDRTPEADAAVKHPVSEIVLVFTEDGPDDLAEREEANYARWENLFRTYPEFFQHSSSYMSICQCNPAGDKETFKKVQGFYIYFEEGVQLTSASPSQPDVAEQTAAEPVSQPVTKAAEPEKTVSQPEPEVPAKKETRAAKEVDKKTEVLEETKPEAEPKPAKEVKRAEQIASDSEEEPAEETREVAPPKPKPLKTTAAKKTGPRRALDPRACRPACYGYGDEDLNTFFAENIKLSKKQKKKAKKAPVNLTLQLNPDGTIKKALTSGPNPELNKMVQTAAESMNPWNAAVKGGVAIKTQVKMTLKYDAESKALKPSGIITNPRPSPKCKCVSDEEIFGTAD